MIVRLFDPRIFDPRIFDTGERHAEYAATSYVVTEIPGTSELA